MCNNMKSWMTNDNSYGSVGDNTSQILLPILEGSLTQPTLISQYYWSSSFLSCNDDNDECDRVLSIGLHYGRLLWEECIIVELEVWGATRPSF